MSSFQLKKAGLCFIQVWERPVVAFIFSFLVYTFIAAQFGSVLSTSQHPYYNYLADAFLHGQLDLRLVPPSIHDLSAISGRYYLYWPPMPAILLMPFVALMGVSVSDILFTIVIGSINVALIALLLRVASIRGVVRVNRVQRGLLVIFFALGTVHATLVPLGRVWFTGQLVGFLFVVLTYIAALKLKGRPAFLAVGLLLSCATLSRYHLLLIGVWPLVYLSKKHLYLGGLRVVRYLGMACLPIGLLLALMLSYNYIRFGDMLETGLKSHRMANHFYETFNIYGPFNFHYIDKNFFYQYLNYPFPFRESSFEGGSLFLLSPVFLAAFYGLIVARPKWSAYTMAFAIFLTSIPILMLMGTGWKQFGPRYTLDFTVPLLLLTAVGVRKWKTWMLGLLTAVSILHYMIGAFWLGNNL